MRFLKKRWHSIPVGLVVVLLALVLATGGALATNGYGFFTATVSVDVEEAIVVAIWPAWDNLEPYGSVGDVEITLGGSEATPEISITTIEGYAGAGFVAGEYIVIPVNFRNAGDGELDLGASVTGGSALDLDYCWRTNTGQVTEVGAENQQLARDFKDDGNWATLDGWTGTIAGNGGRSGSAIVGAQVLFVKISAPEDIAPNTYTFTVTFSRG